MIDPVATLTRRDYVTEWMGNLAFLASCWERFPHDWASVRVCENDTAGTTYYKAVFVGKKEPLQFKFNNKIVKI